MRTQLRHGIVTFESWVLRARGGFWTWTLRLGLALVVALVLFQHAGGSVLSREVPIDLGIVEPYSESARTSFRTYFPHARGDGTHRLRFSSLRLFEDGRELGPAHASHNEIEAEGRGRFSHWGESIVFSSSDGTDPRTNGRSYSTRFERRPTPFVAVLLLGFAFLAWAPLLRRGLLALETRPLLVILVLFLATVALRLAWGFDTGHVDYVRVKEMPFSDAQVWLELSEDFARGLRVSSGWDHWGARRPMTYVINGSWLALVGVSGLAIFALNVLCSGLSAALIFDALRRLAPFPVALVCALLHTGSTLDAAYATTTLSEPSGYFLSNVALWILARALCGERRGEAPRALYFWAGVAIAIANMSRPLTLLSTAGIPLLVLLVLSKRGLGKLNVLKGGLRAGTFAALGVAICLAPWIVRQRVVHGISTLSDNSAEMLFAASDPRFDGWTAEAGLEATKRGHVSWTARNSYYNRLFKENLRDHPGYYAEVIGQSMASSVAQVATPRWWIVGILLLAIWGSGVRRAPGEFFLYTGAALALSLALASGLPPPRVWIFFLLGCSLALLQRHVFSLLVVSLGLTLLGIGLVAAPYPRFTYSLHWLALAIEVWALWRLGQLARKGGFSPDEEELRASGDIPPLAQEAAVTRTLQRLLLVLGAALGLGLLIALARHLDPDLPTPTPEINAPADWLEGALGSPEAADYAAVTTALVVRRFQIRKNFLTSFGANERIKHRSGLFRTQDYARTYFFATPPPSLTRMSSTDTFHAGFPRALRPDQDQVVTVIGCFVAYDPIEGPRQALFEIVALTHDEEASAASWTWGEGEDRRRHARALTERIRAGALAPGPRE